MRPASLIDIAPAVRWRATDRASSGVPKTAAEIKPTVIGETESILYILGALNRDEWTKALFTDHLRVSGDLTEEYRLTPESTSLDDLSAITE